MVDGFLILGGFAIGVLVGLTSIGLGVLGTPMLILLFGISPALATGTQLVHGTIMKTVGVLEHQKMGSVDVQLVTRFVALGIPFAALGAFLAPTFSQEFMFFAIGMVLIFSSLLMLVTLTNSHVYKKIRGMVLNPIRLRGKMLAIPVGAALGFIVGLTSIGSGSLSLLAITALVSIPMRTAVGTNLLLGGLLLFAGAITHIFSSALDFELLSTLLVGSIPGVFFGARLSAKIKPTWVKGFAAILVLLAGLKLIFATIQL